MLSSFSARLLTQVYLDPLGIEDAAGYIAQPLVAGATSEVFSQDAVLSIREATGGVMRKIDVLAPQSLMVSFDANRGSPAVAD